MTAVITFAIPYYRGLDFLGRTLQSIVAQDTSAWQAVVCDDGDEPGVEALVRDLGGGRIRYEKNPGNLGMAKNFNRCVDVADTDLVTVLHADDELMANYARVMAAAAARHPDATALFCRANIIDAHGVSRFSLVDVVKDRLINPAPTRELVLHGEPAVRALLRGNFIMAPTLCFRKSLLKDRRFPEGFKFVMDWELTTRLLLDGDTLVGIPARCYRYRRHEDNATAKYTQTQLRFHEEAGYYERMKAICAERGWDDCVKIANDRWMMKLNVTYLALRHVAALQLDEARRDLRLLREL
jgi:glycosyltransferase involved in cell wall biosynthesis